MLQKHSLLKLSQVKKIVHDVKPQNFHSINSGTTLKTNEIEKSNRFLIQQNNMNSISRQLGTSKQLLIQISATRKAYNSTTSDSKLLSKVILVLTNEILLSQFENATHDSSQLFIFTCLFYRRDYSFLIQFSHFLQD